ncbi:unnamed protein product [Lepeophtheirus salmonis]|uniref:(salmon louse) hypothetical protein n=1 Tax=Lepeophtheirus salmonis TaxID=72036 RepID=A0A7R8CXE3_LEPSM|nr:unnamed protein product [Lepeophtheirus salmonis]CAF2930550.1 unnamed protein product [Lepeophtheirus salmonis]
MPPPKMNPENIEYKRKYLKSQNSVQRIKKELFEQRELTQKIINAFQQELDVKDRHLQKLNRKRHRELTKNFKRLNFVIQASEKKVLEGHCSTPNVKILHSTRFIAPNNSYVLTEDLKSNPPSPITPKNKHSMLLKSSNLGYSHLMENESYFDEDNGSYSTVIASMQEAVIDELPKLKAVSEFKSGEEHHIFSNYNHDNLKIERILKNVGCIRGVIVCHKKMFYQMKSLQPFIKETLKRIELTNTNEDEINLNGRQYVDSSDFRSGIVRSQEEFSPESLLDILGEIDPTYEGTLDSFSPKVFAK